MEGEASHSVTDTRVFTVPVGVDVWDALGRMQTMMQEQEAHGEVHYYPGDGAAVRGDYNWRRLSEKKDNDKDSAPNYYRDGSDNIDSDARGPAPGRRLGPQQHEAESSQATTEREQGISSPTAGDAGGIISSSYDAAVLDAQSDSDIYNGEKKAAGTTYTKKRRSKKAKRRASLMKAAGIRTPKTTTTNKRRRS